jgi:hypothetical protein
MGDAKLTSKTIRKIGVDTCLVTWVEAFLIDRKAQHLAPGTLSYYKNKLRDFTNFAASRATCLQSA